MKVDSGRGARKGGRASVVLLGAAVAVVVTSAFVVGVRFDGAVLPHIRPMPVPRAEFGVPAGPRTMSPAERREGALEEASLLLLALTAASFAVLLSSAVTLEVGSGSRRRSEAAVRTALGATPGVRRREILDEHLLPLLTSGLIGGALVGGAGGVVALWLWPGPLSWDGSGWVPFLGVILLASGGVVAAGLCSRHVTERALRPLLAEPRSTADPWEGGLRRVVSVLQIAATAGMTIGGVPVLRALGAAPEGGHRIGPDRAADTWIVPVTAAPSSAADRTERYADLLAHVRNSRTFAAESLATPGAWSLTGRLDFVLNECGACVVGRVYMPYRSALVTQNVVTPDFFRQTALTLLDGRLLDATDTADSEKAAVVNASYAHAYFEAGDPLGKRLRFGLDDWHTVVGVVSEPDGHALGRAVGDDPAVYLPVAQHPPDRVELAVTAPGLDRGVIVEALTPAPTGLTVEERQIELLTVRRARSRGMLRWLAVAAAGLAVVALAASLVGITATTRVEVAATERVLGVRAALGASPARLRRRVLGRTLRATGLGLFLAIPVAIGVTGLLQIVAGPLPVLDLPAYAVVAALTVAAALGGAIPSTHEAGRADPGRLMAHG